MASSDTPPRTVPVPVPVPEIVDPELEPLLNEPFASAWAASADPGETGSAALRGRLLDRLAASRAASARMVTSRFARTPVSPLAAGVSLRTLYAAPGDRPLRPGEPLRTGLIELEPGARWTCPGSERHREWLVLRGRVRLGNEALAVRDYRVVPPGTDDIVMLGDTGALVFVRESVLPAGTHGEAFTVRDAQAGWPDFAPGIRRRVLWQQGEQAALLYHAQPGASVPMHSHGHDEECLMVQGELFLDDILLQQGDYQLAPAGTGHRITETDTGVVLYAHGDLDLKFVG